MKYFTASGAEYTVDSLIVDEDDASIQYHTYTKYTNCDVLAHAKPLGVRLEIRGGQRKLPGRFGYLSFQRQTSSENKIPLIRYFKALEKGPFLFPLTLTHLMIRSLCKKAAQTSFPPKA